LKVIEKNLKNLRLLLHIKEIMVQITYCQVMAPFQMQRFHLMLVKSLKKQTYINILRIKSTKINKSAYKTILKSTIKIFIPKVLHFNALMTKINDLNRE
jgi:uncharacterized protein (UPF0305 family)